MNDKCLKCGGFLDEVGECADCEKQSDELDVRLTVALEELRKCVTLVGKHEECRELLYHAGRTIMKIREKNREA